MDQAVVIGGGVAGASAAIVLARAGRDVVLLEKQQGPAHKVCGEFLSPETIPALHALDVDPLSLGGVPIQRVRLHSRFGNAASALNPAGCGLSRYALDAALLESARRAGAEIRSGCSVLGYHADGEGYVVRTHSGEVRASHVVLATGKHELPSVKVREGVRRDAIGFKMHWQPGAEARRLLGSDVAMFMYRGGYAGLCMVEEGRMNLCLILDRQHYRDCGGSFDGLLDWLSRSRPGLYRLLADSSMRWERPLSVSNVPYGYVHTAPRTKSGEREYHVGDQFGVVPSLAGTGMAIALLTGCAAARGIIAGLTAHEVNRTVHRDLASNIRFMHRIHRLGRHPAFSEAVVFALRGAPVLLRRLVSSSRIGVAVS